MTEDKMAQNKDNKRITFDLPKPLAAKLERECFAKMTSVAQLIRFIIHNHYEAKKK